MKKAWNKASRVISALLVLGMFASVVPAQVLAVDEPDSQVEQQDKEQTTEETSSGEVATNDLQAEEDQAEGAPELLSAGEERFGSNDLWLDYTIVNKSKNVSVKYVYAYSNAFPVQEDILEPGDAFTKYICPLNGTSTVMFFFKVPTGYTFDTKFTSDAKGRVEPLTEIDSQPGNKLLAHDFRQEIDQAINDGYTYGFYYTDWACFAFKDRGFKIELTPVDYQIEYNVNEGTLPEDDSCPTTYNLDQLGNAGLTIGKPSRDNYTFAGWTQDGVPGDPQTNMTIEPGTTGNLSFTAHWNVDINFNFDAVKEELVTLNGYTGKLIGEDDMPGTERDGYIFNGWYDEAGNKVENLPTVFPNENVTYFASYDEDFNGNGTLDKEENYTVTYEAEGNGYVTEKEQTACVQNMDGIQGSEAVADTGYIVDGWYKDDMKVTDKAVLTPEVIKDNLNTENDLYKDTTFTARFVKQETPAALTSYTVRYLEDGTGYEVASPKTVSGVAVGTTITETAPDIAGYTVTSDKNPQTITIGTGENKITFYYKAVGPDQPVVTPSDTTTTTAPAAAAAPVIPRITTPAAGGTATGTAGTTGPTVTAAPADGDGDNAAEEPEEEVVPEEETPQAQEPADESIADEETPLADSTASGWALLNLILAILAVIGAIVLVVGYFAGYQNIWRLLSLIPAIGGVAAFFMTEDMSLPMAFVDGWTVLMVIIAVVQIVVAVMALKNKDEAEDEAEDENA